LSASLAIDPQQLFGYAIIMGTKVKGRTTLRTAAVCFLASAVFELVDVFAPVPLWGK
jgi:hypothetical protein